MKRLFSFLILATAVFLQGCQSMTHVVTESTPVTTVVKVDGASQNDLYVKANNWMVDHFHNAESVIQFSDKESGNIAGRYLLGVVVAPSDYGAGEKAYATIKVKVKDGASKITITPESFQYMQGNMFTLYTKENADADIERLMQSFKVAMTHTESDDW
ncbi:DUF4468 domain-containing protein [Vibrio variabilis]|uniref:DUF4468 domain-containing protein n=1 Tax=Vibrio variabilis TaxID=990271 RepID=UPI000DD6732F|nr:DUF4468 domain-containing protein [Vibrio variabilis]